jgi:hypothetical protein
MEVNDLSFDGIVRCLNDVIGKINDPLSAILNTVIDCEF